MNKHTLKYFAFLSTSFSVITGVGGIIASEAWIQIGAFVAMAALGFGGALFFARFKKYSNGLAHLTNVVNSLQQPSVEWEFRSVRNEAELRSVWKISQDIYKEENVPYETVLTWWNVYPDGIFIAYKNSKIAGYFSMWPIKVNSYKHVLSGRRKERELTWHAIDGKKSLNPRAYWYVTNIVVVREFRKTEAAKILLTEALRKWVNEANLAEKINICAFGYSKEGEALIKRFGFHEFKESTETADHLPLYLFTSSCEDVNRLVNRLGVDNQVAMVC
jgi:predicted GNAT family N-acyltransferase